MKFDETGAIITDQAYPSCVGDSCAETSRYAVLEPTVECGLETFLSPLGFLRHEDAPYGPPDSLTSWRESDASGDQVFPLLMACDMRNMTEMADEIRSRIKKNWTIRKGILATPAMLALVYKQFGLLRALTRTQEWIFKLSFRWSDSKERFEDAAESSADWLNFAVTLVYLRSKGIRYDFNDAKIMEKVRAYYSNEQNAEWIIDAYVRHLEPSKIS